MNGAESLGLALSEGALASFDIYCRVLLEKNRVMNLTAITEEDEAARLHFLDSLALLTLADFRNAAVIDVGSGAGFPGLPLKLAEPTVELTLLDAQRKRVDFLRELCGQLGTSAVCVHDRAEEAHDLRERFDFAV
jgi:16S rRNA (guanine527-N7)-methyltransferase